MTQWIFSLCLLLLAGFASGQEICDNLIDDDNDGLVDLDDKQDCPCMYSGATRPSIIYNPSFELLGCVPTGPAQLSCAQGWSQATNGSADLFVQNAFMPYAAPADGKSFAGTSVMQDYKEYLGTCLTETMRKGQSYTLVFSLAATRQGQGQPCDPAANVPIPVTLYGHKYCPGFPLNTDGCPSDSGFIELGTVNYLPSSGWSKIRLDFVALEDISSVIIGPGCKLPAGFKGDCYNYLLWDDLQLKQTEGEPLYYVPNSFTPDDNELNQRFEPVFTCGFDPMHYELKIYNRWGVNIFTSNDSRIGWDGTYGGVMMPDGVYAWTIRYKSQTTDDAKLESGHVSLLR